MFNIIKRTKQGDTVTHRNITSPRYAANMAEALTRYTGVLHCVEGFDSDSNRIEFNEFQVQELMYDLAEQDTK